jgi:hypothetical protein
LLDLPVGLLAGRHGSSLLAGEEVGQMGLLAITV